MEHSTVQDNISNVLLSSPDPFSLQSPSSLIPDLEPDLLTALQSSEAAIIRGGVPVATRSTSSLDSAPIAIATPVLERASEWSHSLQTLLDQPPSSLPKRLAIGGIAFCCMFGVWAWFGKAQEISHAQGHLVPQGETYKIQPAISGEVTQIRVEEGQSIRAGQIIATLDDRLASSEIDRLTQSLNAYRLELLQTENLIDRATLTVQTQEAIAAAATQIQVASIAEAQAKAATNQALLPQLEAKVTAYQDRLTRLQPLVEEGAIAQDRLFESEQALRDQQQAVIQNQGELQQMVAEANRLQAGMAAQQAEAHKKELDMLQQVQQLNVEAAQLQAKITETETLLKAAQTRLKQLFLYAPADGLVSSLQVHRMGEVIEAGQTLAEITPANTPLVLSAAVPNQEIGLVQKDMKVQIKFDAFPYQDYGILSGRIISISPDAKMDDQRGSFYQVKIALDKAHVAHNQDIIALKAGQTASAEIVTSQRRIIDIILDPIRKLQSSNLNF
jgi:hemolysin D